MNPRQTLLLGAALVLPAAARAADRVGSRTCAACHPKAYAAWSAGPHARAAESLDPAHRRDLACLHCHAPEVPLTKTAVWDKPPTRAEREGIPCETCHGAGESYAPEYVMRDAELARAVGLRDPGERTCRACHLPGSPSLSPFDYQTAVRLIDHWSAEKASARSRGSP